MQQSTVHSEDHDLQAALAKIAAPAILKVSVASLKMPTNTTPATVGVLGALGGGEDETPAHVVVTCIQISKERQAKRASTSNVSRRSRVLMTWPT